MSDHKGKMFCSSRDVAEKFGKKHSAVLKDIRNLDCSKEFYKENFEEKQDMFMMTRNGFMFLIMGYTDPKAMELKMALIQEYDHMEELITR